MLLDVRQSVFTVAHGKISDSEIAKQPGERDCGRKTNDRRFERARGKYKNLKRGRRRQKRGNQHAAEAVALDPMPNRVGPGAGLAMKIGFAAHERQVIK